MNLLDRESGLSGYRFDYLPFLVLMNLSPLSAAGGGGRVARGGVWGGVGGGGARLVAHRAISGVPPPSSPSVLAPI